MASNSLVSSSSKLDTRQPNLILGNRASTLKFEQDFLLPMISFSSLLSCLSLPKIFQPLILTSPLLFISPLSGVIMMRGSLHVSGSVSIILLTKEDPPSTTDMTSNLCPMSAIAWQVESPKTLSIVHSISWVTQFECSAKPISAWLSGLAIRGRATILGPYNVYLVFKVVVLFMINCVIWICCAFDFGMS